ncbi:hypothetical protein [Chitinophaga nivalis]|uniref:Bacteriocin n=1 Tax=Chitinophaga nivalis TaxID=2991709 RepID=A0ABT3IKU1_9BACT|nr:hypothetical protein [Chitinophaga nivalis]MCW3465766.1 hypothetical protein [Chitinophaga nivalis]MCW3484543.1 hypothetical protein [Chitinophaga nivalis]
MKHLQFKPVSRTALKQIKGGGNAAASEACTGSLCRPFGSVCAPGCICAYTFPLSPFGTCRSKAF